MILSIIGSNLHNLLFLKQVVSLVEEKMCQSRTMVSDTSAQLAKSLCKPLVVNQ